MASHEIFRTSYSSAQVSGTYIRRAGTIVLSLLTPNLAKASLLSNPIRLLSSITKPDDVVDGAFNNTDSLNDLAIRKRFTECKQKQHRPVVLSETEQISISTYVKKSFRRSPLCCYCGPSAFRFGLSEKI